MTCDVMCLDEWLLRFRWYVLPTSSWSNSLRITWTALPFNTKAERLLFEASWMPTEWHRVTSRKILILNYTAARISNLTYVFPSQPASKTTSSTSQHIDWCLQQWDVSSSYVRTAAHWPNKTVSKYCCAVTYTYVPICLIVSHNAHICHVLNGNVFNCFWITL